MSRSTNNTDYMEIDDESDSMDVVIPTRVEIPITRINRSKVAEITKIPVRKPVFTYKFPTASECTKNPIFCKGNFQLLTRGSDSESDSIPTAAYTSRNGKVDACMQTNIDSLNNTDIVFLDAQNIRDIDPTQILNTNAIPVLLERTSVYRRYFNNPEIKFCVVAVVDIRYHKYFTEGDDISLLIVYILAQKSGSFKNYLKRFYPDYVGGAYVWSRDFYRKVTEHFFNKNGIKFEIYMGKPSEIASNPDAQICMPVEMKHGNIKFSFEGEKYCLSRDEFTRYIIYSNDVDRIAYY